MTIHVNIGEAKTQLSKLIAAVLRGEEVTIDRAGVPQVRIVPFDNEQASDSVREARLAWMGSGRGLVPPGAGDMFLEPTYTQEEMDTFEREEEERLAEATEGRKRA